MAALAHVSVHTTIRPPRVVILFRGDENWRRWARLALMAASNTWAGGGHLLVPYSADGSVSDRMLEAVRHFDPDHVLLLSPTLAEWEWASPGFINFLDASGDPMDPDELQSMLSDFGQMSGHEDAAGERARELLEDWCTPFFMAWPREQAERRDQLEASIQSDGSSNLVTAAGLPKQGMDRYVAVPQNWESDAALVAGGQWGVVEANGNREEPAPQVLLTGLVRGIVGRRPADELWLGSPREEVQSRFDVLDVDLDVYQVGRADSRGAVVVGDTVEDFAFAQACRVLFGFGLWLPSSLFEDNDVFRGATVPMIMNSHTGFGNARTNPKYVSTSLDDEVLDSYLKRLDDQTTGRFVEPKARNRVVRTDFPGLAGLQQVRAFREEVMVPAAVAVERDEDGTMAMVTPYALPSPSAGGLYGKLLPPWIVDVVFDDAEMPTGRSVGPEHLVVPTSWPESVVRSSKYGIAVVAASHGFVESGAVKSRRQARPRLISLGIKSWAGAMAAERGLTVRSSLPGNNAEVVARRLGSRDALVDLITGPMHPALKLFAGTDESISKRKQRLDVLPPEMRSLQPRWVGDMPYATVEAMRHAAGLASAAPITDVLDRLTEADLVRRGLTVRCLDCGRESFVPVDRLGRTYECPRCSAVNVLVSARWGGSVEPPWRYDLHNALRHVMTEHGDIPLMAAKHLEASARRYVDVGELEFLRSGTQIAEMDLIANVDGDVVIVEAKSSATLGGAKEARRTAAKIAEVAYTLHADRVILATDQKSWRESDQSLVEQALGRHFKSFATPRVDLLTGLAAARAGGTQ